MYITTRQSRIFEAVAETGSITRAAETLHLTQPAVSMQVRKLEEAAGLPLIEHQGRRIRLTAAGREMLYYCRRINRTLLEARRRFEQLRNLGCGHLHLAVASTVNYFATELIARFHRRHPGIQVRMDVTNREHLLQILEAGDRDLVLMGQPPDSGELEAVAFMDNPLVVIAAADHPLVGKRRITMKRLAREPFVLRESGSGTRMALERLLARKGIHLEVQMEMNSNEAIKQAVIAGLGLGIVSLHTVRMELETGRLQVLEVAGFPIRRKWYLVHRKDRCLSPAAEEFKRYLLEYAEREGREGRDRIATEAHGRGVRGEG